MATEKKQIGKKKTTTKTKVVTTKRKNKVKKPTLEEQEVISVSAVTSEKNKYEEQMITIIDEVETKILKLKKDSEHLKDQAKDKFDHQIAFLSKKKSELETSLQDIKSSSGEKWHLMQKSTEDKIIAIEEEAKNVFEGFRGGLNYLFSKFKK